MFCFEDALLERVVPRGQTWQKPHQRVRESLWRSMVFRAAFRPQERVHSVKGGIAVSISVGHPRLGGNS